MANSVLQIIDSGDIIANVGTPDEVTAALQDAEPGRYVIEESSTADELLPSGFSRQRWGVAIRQADGTVALEPEPAPVRSRGAAVSNALRQRRRL